MKTLFLVSMLLTAVPAFADQWVNGYYRADGSYVEGYQRTYANDTPVDNYSYPGNYNPNNARRENPFRESGRRADYYRVR